MTEKSNNSQVRLVTVEADEMDRRLDNFLLGRLKGVPRSRVYRMIRGGEVRVNKGRIKPQYRLKTGDVVRIPPVRTACGEVRRLASRDRLAWIESHIIHEDPDLLVLNKPAGLAVHGGSGIDFGAIELLRMARSGERYLELVHRLDRDTSGCLMIARKRSSLRKLHEYFRTGGIQKRYLALLSGRMKAPKYVADEPLLTVDRQGGERHVRVDAQGKPATSIFRVQDRFSLATLCEVDLVTGRTHQIRVHAAHLGHPVAGDARYGLADDPTVAAYGLRRMFLHAATLVFMSPSNQEPVEVRCPLEPELAGLLKRMRARGK